MINSLSLVGFLRTSAYEQSYFFETRARVPKEHTGHHQGWNAQEGSPSSLTWEWPWIAMPDSCSYNCSAPPQPPFFPDNDIIGIGVSRQCLEILIFSDMFRCLLTILEPPASRCSSSWFTISLRMNQPTTHLKEMAKAKSHSFQIQWTTISWDGYETGPGTFQNVFWGLIGWIRVLVLGWKIPS